MLLTKDSYIYSFQFDSMSSNFAPASEVIEEHHLREQTTSPTSAQMQSL